MCTRVRVWVYDVKSPAVARAYSRGVLAPVLQKRECIVQLLLHWACVGGRLVVGSVVYRLRRKLIPNPAYSIVRAKAFLSRAGNGDTRDVRTHRVLICHPTRCRLHHTRSRGFETGHAAD